MLMTVSALQKRKLRLILQKQEQNFGFNDIKDVTIKENS